jgi:hypothetical protein
MSTASKPSEKMQSGGMTYQLFKHGTRDVVQQARRDIAEFNRKERERSGVMWRNIYSYRIKKYKSCYAIYLR